MSSKIGTRRNKAKFSTRSNRKIVSLSNDELSENKRVKKSKEKKLGIDCIAAKKKSPLKSVDNVCNKSKLTNTTTPSRFDGKENDVFKTELDSNLLKQETIEVGKRSLWVLPQLENAPESTENQPSKQPESLLPLTDDKPSPTKVPKRRGRPPGKNSSKIAARTAREALSNLEMNKKISSFDQDQKSVLDQNLSKKQNPETYKEPKKRGRKRKNPENITKSKISNGRFNVPASNGIKGRPTNLSKIRSYDITQNLKNKTAVLQIIKDLTFRVAKSSGNLSQVSNNLINIDALKEISPNNAFIPLIEDKNDIFTNSKNNIAIKLDVPTIFTHYKPLNWVKNVNLRLLIAPFPQVDAMPNQNMVSCNYRSSNFINYLNKPNMMSNINQINKFNRVIGESDVNAATNFDQNSISNSDETERRRTANDKLIIGRMCSPPRSKSESRQAFAPDLKALADMLQNEGCKKLGKNRPPFSLATLAYMALVKGNCSSPKGMTMSEICSWIAENFQYYRIELEKTLQHPKNEDNFINKIRHTLSSNKCFVKMGKVKKYKRSDVYRSHYWRLDPTYSTISIYKQFYDADQEQFQNDFYSLYNFDNISENCSEYNNDFSLFENFDTEYLGENYLQNLTPESNSPGALNYSTVHNQNASIADKNKSLSQNCLNFDKSMPDNDEIQIENFNNSDFNHNLEPKCSIGNDEISDFRIPDDLCCASLVDCYSLDSLDPVNFGGGGLYDNFSEQMIL